ncbi:MAG: hypothetical protein HY370_03205 [Proteobacteria bacterium]|nr:hypothetical protein [Pseudomonadota bacterium]
MTFNAARFVGSVSWQNDDFEDVVVTALRRACGSKPALILNDMTDQHFKGGQRMPRVGAMDKANVLKRKLQVSFPNYPIRGALPLKWDKGESGGKKKHGGGLYLFAGIPMSEPVAKSFSAVKAAMVPIAGFCLLPVEGAEMVQTLAVRLAGKSRKPSRWVVFMGQHRDGGLRQVITRDGQLAMTRMTPMTEADNAPDIWARDVSQEFKATISYLSRFGFSSAEGVDLIVISDSESGALLENLVNIPCHYTALSAPEAAREIGMNIGVQDNSRYADPLYAAWSGRKSRFTLPMEAVELARIGKPRQVAALFMVGLILAGGYLGWHMFSMMQSMSAMQDDLDNQKRILAQAEKDHQQEVDRMAALGFDVRLVQGAIETYSVLDKDKMRTLTLIKKLGEALGDNLRLDIVTVDYITPPPLDPQSAAALSGQEQQQRPQVNMLIKLSFPPSVEPEVGVREVNDLKRRLTATMPGYDVVVQRNVAGLEYSDTFSGAVGRSAKDIASEKGVAEISIRGAIQ